MTKVPDSMLVNPQGGNGITTIAYTTTLPLDYTAGKDMGSHTVSTAEVWAVGAGPIQNGALQVILVGAVGGSLAVPGNWTLFPGSSPPVLSAGSRNLVGIFYVGNSVMWSSAPMSALDVIAPTLVSATVSDTDATRLDLVWSESISAAISAATAFAVSAGHSISAHTYVDPTHTYLTVSPVFVQGEAARTLAYTQPAVNLMQDLAGNLLANIASASITNNVTTPTLVSATVPDSDPLRINLVWSESMNATVSAAAAFAVSSVHAVSAHTYDTVTTSHLTTTVPFITGESAKTLAYTQPGSNKMMDLGGNLVANIASAAITNSVSSPTLLSAVVANSTPTKIDLTWSEAMNVTVLASAANFAVSSGHALTGHVNIDATHSQLTTSTAFVASETKTLAYTASGTSDMKDTAGGNLVQNFSGAAITDNVGSSGIADTFNRANGALGTASDGGTWTLLTGTAPVISSNKLVAGAAAGDIARDLTYQNGTYSVDVNTTVGTFNPVMRIFSDGSASTNYVGVAIDTAADASAFGVSVYTHSSGAFGNVGCPKSNTAVFASGVTGTLSVVITGAPSAPSMTLKFNGTTIPSTPASPATPAVAATIAGNAGATKTGPMVPATGVSLDNFSAV